MTLVRMKVLKAFSRNLDFAIVHGDPEHPDENGRFVEVSPAAATLLERDGQAEPYSLKDEARDELERERQEREGDVGHARAPAGSTAKSAQQVRNERTDTGTSDTGRARRKAPAGRRPKAGQRGGAPAGGRETTATTNHPNTTTVGGAGDTSDTTDQTAVLASPTNDPDTPPVE